VANHATLKLTAAGLAAIADGANVGTRTVRFTRAQAGSGLKPGNADDTSRAALRTPKDAAPVSGNSEVPARIAWRVDITSTGSYRVTELGLFARIGAGAEFLAAYWAAESVGGSLAALVAGQKLTLAGIIELVNPTAEVNLTATPTIVFHTADTGDVKMSAAADVPAGWLECDGAAVSRTDYARLFRAIGTAYGAGDGARTFSLPDLRGRVPVGRGDGGAGLTERSRGATGGAETHRLTVEEMPSHTHRLGSRLGVPKAGAITLDSGTGEADTVLSTGSTGGDRAHNNMQPFGVVRYVIKT